MTDSFEQRTVLRTGGEYSLATCRKERAMYLGKENRTQNHLFVIDDEATIDQTRIVYIPVDHYTLEGQVITDSTCRYTTLSLSNIPNKKTIQALICYAREVNELERGVVASHG